MSKLSRPFQLALVAMGVLVAVWFVALRGHSGSTAGSNATVTPASATTTTVTPASATTTNPGAPSAIYHGSAPGLEGLTRDIARAHEAVAKSERNAKQLAEKSAQASSITPAAAAASATAGGAAAGAQPASATTAKGSVADKAARTHAAAPTRAAVPATSTQSATASKPAATSKAAPQGTTSSAARANAAPALQTQVEHQLAQDGTVIILFWNPIGADDVYVRHQLQLLQAHHRTEGLPQNRNIAVHLALANEVASYGSITRSVQIVGTPTILIITRQGKAKTLTGLWDAYSIQQAIGEARE